MNKALKFIKIILKFLQFTDGLVHKKFLTFSSYAKVVYGDGPHGKELDRI